MKSAPGAGSCPADCAISPLRMSRRGGSTGGPRPRRSLGASRRFDRLADFDRISARWRNLGRRRDRGRRAGGHDDRLLPGEGEVPSVVVERDAIGSHASGFAYGGLSPLSGFGIPGPLAAIAQDGMSLHRALGKSLLEETGIDVDFRERASLALALTEADVRRLQAALPWQQQQPGYAVHWLDAAEARRVEPRIADETQGATLIEGGAGVEPYRLVLALTRAAERLGARVRHGRAIGLGATAASHRRGPRARDDRVLHRGARPRPLGRRDRRPGSACRSTSVPSRARSCACRRRVRRSTARLAGATTTPRPRPTASCGRGRPRRRWASTRSRRSRPATRSGPRS